MFRTTLLLLLFFGLNHPVISQDAKQSRKARQEAAKNRQIQMYNKVGAMIESRDFVLEIENIYYPASGRKMINPMVNCIIIDTTSCFWLSENADIPNDLFKKVNKAEGTVDGWKLSKDSKHLRYSLQFRMFTDNGLFRVFAYFHPDRTFTGNINGVRDNFQIDGRIVVR
jgi:hypothetical protein